jgi:AcrR family transcriptional regulator
VGSLYQYYPGKEALVVAVIERHSRDIMQLFRASLADVMAQPVAVAVPRLIAAAIDAHRVDPELHRVLAEQIPRTGSLEHVDAYNREAFGLFLAYLERHREEVCTPDLTMAAYISVSAIEALTHNAVLHHPEMLSGEGVDRLVAEATRLVLGYLQPVAAA